MGHKHSKTGHYTFDNSKNIYGEKLVSCRNKIGDNGSWDHNGKCSELHGGVHQICVSNITNDFSSETSQSTWSKKRAGNPHCVCLGAYALYTAKKKHINLNCDAIPETVFDPNYVEKWNTWNGYEKKTQGSISIKKLYDYCNNQPINKTKKSYLKSRYHNMKTKMDHYEKKFL